ncbi:MAG: hypothetical protein ACI4WH_06955 [Oscillospiraceae bacterium]
MFTISIAKLNIGIDNKYQYIEILCKDYITHSPNVDFYVSVTEDEIYKERTSEKFSMGYCESICIYRKICTKILHYDAYLFHSCVVEVDNQGYVFSAKSGVGKSTHGELWLKYFKDRAKIINGDKPIFRIFESTLNACGTPWNGKENLGSNIIVPIKSICFIERSTENYIYKASQDDITNRFFHQTIMPTDYTQMMEFLNLVDFTINNIPFYVLGCNISQDAVELAYNYMKD